MEGEPPQTTNYKCTKNHYEHKHKSSKFKNNIKTEREWKHANARKNCHTEHEGRRPAGADKNKNSRCLQIGEIPHFESQGQFIVNEMQYSMQIFTLQTVTPVPQGLRATDWIAFHADVLGGSSRVPPRLIGVITFSSMPRKESTVTWKLEIDSINPEPNRF